MIRVLKISVRFLKWFILSCIVLIALYLMFAFAFSIIPVNQNMEPGNDVEIFIQSNGVHLDIVVPIKNEIKDWTNEVWIDSTILKSTRLVGFGWGDKEFYLNTPEWSDLTIKTAVRAVLLKSPSALHISYYSGLQTRDNCKKITITIEQYKAIVDFIENSFKRTISGNTIRIDGFQYGQFDCFYEAKKTYHLFFTCNTWTNKCLKEAELKASLWTPFTFGTLYHYRKNNSIKQN